MKKTIFLFVIIQICYSMVASAQKQKTNAKYKLVWSDEFNYNGLPDSKKWDYNTGNNGFGNGELQNYNRDDTANAKVINGALEITARKHDTGSYKYSSARMVTKNKADWKYGKIEVKAILAKGRGICSAIWMMPSESKYGDWPACGEIDIMEHVDYVADSVFQTVHTGSYNHLNGTQKGGKAFVSNPYSEFHIYAIEWTPEVINFLVDEKPYYSFKNEHKTFNEWPFDQSFYLIFNISVGGRFESAHGLDDSLFPATMKIDYVRVYQ